MVVCRTGELNSFYNPTKGDSEMSKQWVRCLLVGAMLAFGVGSVQASAVYSNLPFDNSGTPYNVSSDASLTRDGIFDALYFTTAAGAPGTVDYQISSVTLLMKRWDSTEGVIPVVAIYGGTAANGPTTWKATFNDTTDTIPGAVDSVGYVNFKAPDNLFLDPSASYWLLLYSSDALTTKTGDFGWSYTYTGQGASYQASGAWYPKDGNAGLYIDAGPVANLVIGGPYPAGLTDLPYQMQLDTVPEPSTYALLIIGLGVVGYARKRMNKE
jgi:hypothetical protein